MRFVTFQPCDWKTSKRKEEWHDIYWDTLGFDPVWCIPAESLEQALVNGLLTCPTTPERAIFFKTNDFYMIPKIEHYNYVIEKNEEKSVLLSSKELKDFLQTDNSRENVATFLLKKAPYQFEYLVSPDAMNIKAEIDIDKRLSETIFDDSNCVCKQEAEKIIEQRIENARMYF